MMAEYEYIEKAALMSLIKSEARRWGDDYDWWQCLADIEDFKPADVQPVRKAEWVYEPYDPLISRAEIVCSHCGAKPWWCGVDENVLPSYCPHCGAEMIGPYDTKED